MYSFLAALHYLVLAAFFEKELMRMKLVLAEKPSAAQSFAKVLGAIRREDGYCDQRNHPHCR